MDGDADLEDCIRFCAYLFGASAAEDTPFCFFCNGIDALTRQPVRTAESWGISFALEQSRTLARLSVGDAKKIDLFLQEDAAFLSASQLILVSTYLDDGLKAFARDRRAGAPLYLFSSAEEQFPVTLKIIPILFLPFAAARKKGGKDIVKSMLFFLRTRRIVRRPAFVLSASRHFGGIPYRPAVRAIILASIGNCPAVWCAGRFHRMAVGSDEKSSSTGNHTFAGGGASRWIYCRLLVSDGKKYFSSGAGCPLPGVLCSRHVFCYPSFR